MVVIRLARTGKKHDPKYRITVADQRKYVTGKFIEVIGSYIPTPRGKETHVQMDIERYQEWVKKGAKPTDRVKHVVKLAQAQK
ncbi:MAG: 30S ribosomal protein S16 [Bdellovibrionaceae bacterium]|nr:30S ribosomal protein S16 [Pseudobdellovibrionaceae bacterium]